MFIDHQTGDRAYFKRQTRQTVKVAENYGKIADTYGLWDSVGAVEGFSYQLLICDKESSSNMKYSGFFISGYTGCYKTCDMWCDDIISPYFRTSSNRHGYKGVAFNVSAHEPNQVTNRLISVGLRWDVIEPVSMLWLTLLEYINVNYTHLNTESEEKSFCFNVILSAKHILQNKDK